MKKTWNLLLLSLTVLTFCGCYDRYTGNFDQYPDINNLPSGVVDQAGLTDEDKRRQLEFLKKLDEQKEPVYRINAGDKISIRVYNHPDLIMESLAHSDGDVLLHALMDALLGAAGERDIGYQFPDNAGEYKDIDSRILLARTRDILAGKNLTIEYADMTVVAQKPKLKPYIEAMRTEIARVLGIDVSRVNVKATTEEKMGFTGRGEGIAAHAVCLLAE